MRGGLWTDEGCPEFRPGHLFLGFPVDVPASATLALHDAEPVHAPSSSSTGNAVEAEQLVQYVNDALKEKAKRSDPSVFGAEPQIFAAFLGYPKDLEKALGPWNSANPDWVDVGEEVVTEC